MDKKMFILILLFLTAFNIDVVFGVAQDSDRPVYAHFLTWFKTKDFSGKWEMWNSDWTQAPHNPDHIFMDGKRRDLAVTTYPLTDAYDTCDPAAIEYQFLLMKLSGVDGVIVDWDGRRINRYRHDALMTILPYLGKYDLKLMMCFEEWCGYWPKGIYPDRAAEIKAAQDELKWMMETFLSKPFYGTVKGKKPVLVFRKVPDKWFKPDEWKEISKVFDGTNIELIFDLGAYREFGESAGGKFFWVGSFDLKTNNSSLYFCKNVYANFFKTKNDTVKDEMVFGGVTPGFDDSPVWGWGNVARKAPRYDGKRFELTWEMSIEKDVDLVQIVTWNDWNEGSQIEPCEKFGYDYLKANKKYSALYKGIENDVPECVWDVPLKIYKARKSGNADSKKLDQISQALLKADYELAIKLAKEI